MSQLTPKQRQFIEEYLIDKNGSAAVIRAGFTQKPSSAKTIAARLLTKENVKTALAQALQEQQANTKITAERILEEIGRVALSDLSQAYNDDGTMKKVQDMPKDFVRALASVEVDEIWSGGSSERRQLGNTTKLKVLDKVRALELYAKHFKLLTDVMQLNLVDNIAERLKAARLKRANG